MASTTIYSADESPSHVIRTDGLSVDPYQPIADYTVLVVFWLYYSFWRLHRKIEEGRQRRKEDIQQMARDQSEDSPLKFSDQDIDGPA